MANNEQTFASYNDVAIQATNQQSLVSFGKEQIFNQLTSNCSRQVEDLAKVPEYKVYNVFWKHDYNNS